MISSRKSFIDKSQILKVHEGNLHFLRQVNMHVNSQEYRYASVWGSSISSRIHMWIYLYVGVICHRVITSIKKVLFWNASNVRLRIGIVSKVNRVVGLIEKSNQACFYPFIVCLGTVIWTAQNVGLSMNGPILVLYIKGVFRIYPRYWFIGYIFKYSFDSDWIYISICLWSSIISK